MGEQDWMLERFEQHRQRLLGAACRMLGSASEAEDAVQEAWLRFSRSDTSGVENLGSWLTTVVSRVCLNTLQARRSHPEEPLGPGVPQTVPGGGRGTDPEQEAMLADSIGLAMLVVLDALSPAERVAFVLHDMFAVPFEEIAPIVGRSTEAARQLASRARRWVQDTAPVPNHNLSRQREVVDAFFAAARGGDFDALVAVLDPDVVLRSDGGVRRPAASVVVHGAATVAGQALTFAQPSRLTRPALVNGAPGVVVVQHGRPFAIMGFTVMRGKIVEIDVLTDPERLRQLDLTVLDD
jgi:RNA polymerase sigma factor (sigma-70 family)